MFSLGLVRDAMSPQSLLLGGFLHATRLLIYSKREIEMTRNMSVILYILALIAVVVSADFLFFKNRFWERLIVNIGIVLVFAAFYLRFLKNP